MENNKIHNMFIKPDLKIKEFDTAVKDILNTFSTYLDHYDKDYLYNYKFIESHIDEFLNAWKKTVMVGAKCENIKNCIVDSKYGLLNFIEKIYKNSNCFFCVKINNAIEIYSTNSNASNELLKINENSLLKQERLKYSNEYDIEIFVKLNDIEYRKSYRKYDIQEDSMAINLIKKFLDEFVYYYIKLNKFEKVLQYLDEFDYSIYGISEIEIEFDNLFKYNPFKFKNSNSMFSDGSFQFLLNNKKNIKANQYLLKYTISGVKQRRKFSLKIDTINEFEIKFKSRFKSRMINARKMVKKSNEKYSVV